MNISRTRITTVLIGVLALGTGCSDFTWPENTGAAVANYATIVEASYSDSLMTAMALNTALVALVDSPSQATLDAARQAWLDSREPYLQTEVYRFYDGPIDNPTDGPEGAINAWPLDENFIDYVELLRGSTRQILLHFMYPKSFSARKIEFLFALRIHLVFIK